jgi:hypothetical protein
MGRLGLAPERALLIFIEVYKDYLQEVVAL